MRTRVGVLAFVALAGASAVAALLTGAVGVDAPSDRGAPTEAVPEDRRPTPAPSPAPPAEASLVMWSRGELRADVADRVATLPAVTATAFVRSATLGLTASRDADGATVQQLGEGLRIPVSVAAVDPEGLAATLPAESAAAIGALRPGHVLLSETSARLRGIGAGGSLDLATIPGLVVAGVVPDGTVRRAEIVLHVADADAAGIDQDGSVVVRYRTDGSDGTDTSSLEAAIRGLLPADPPVRIVAGGETYAAPLVLSLLEVKDRFGELAYRPRPGVREIDPDPAFVREHIVEAEVPILGTVRCHRGIIDDLRSALGDVVEAGLADEIDPRRYGGCYYPRLISVDRDGLSRHSWGIAIDINVDLSVPGLGPAPPPEVIAAFERHGFRWGGDFLRPDNHHFEWVGADAGRPR